MDGAYFALKPRCLIAKAREFAASAGYVRVLSGRESEEGHLEARVLGPPDDVRRFEEQADE